MNYDEQILAELKSMREDIGTKLNEITQRLEIQERKAKKASAEIAHNAADIKMNDERIKKLQKIVSELAENAAVWHSQNKPKREIGIDTKSAYEAFGTAGYKSTEALRTLYSLGRLSRNDEHFTRPVRVGGSVIRAVVIFEDK